jgi:hypothetical protein
MLGNSLQNVDREGRVGGFRGNRGRHRDTSEGVTCKLKDDMKSEEVGWCWGSDVPEEERFRAVVLLVGSSGAECGM